MIPSPLIGFLYTREPRTDVSQFTGFGADWLKSRQVALRVFLEFTVKDLGQLRQEEA